MKAILIDLDGTKTAIEVPENAPDVWMVPVETKIGPPYGATGWIQDSMRSYKLEWIYPASSQDSKWALYREVGYGSVELEQKKEQASKKFLDKVAKAILEKMSPEVAKQFQITASKGQYYSKKWNAQWTSQTILEPTTDPISTEPLQESTPIEPPKLPPVEGKKKRKLKLSRA